MAPQTIPFSTASDYGIGKADGPSPALMAVLRLVTLLCSFIGFVSMASNKHSGISFKEYNAFSLVVGITFLVMLYNFIFFIWQSIKLCSSNKYWTRGILFVQVVGEFILLLLLFSAFTASGAQTTQNQRNYIAVRYHSDQTIFIGKGAAWCRQLKNAGYGKRYCSQAEASTAFAALASFVSTVMFWLLTGAYFKA